MVFLCIEYMVAISYSFQTVKHPNQQQKFEKLHVLNVPLEVINRNKNYSMCLIHVYIKCKFYAPFQSY